MTFTSVAFYVFLAISLLCYYAMPLNKRWVALLFAGIFFYVFADVKALIFVALSSLSIYFCTVKMQNISDKYDILAQNNGKEWLKENKKSLNQKIKAEKKIYLISALAFNLLILFGVKYTPFILNNFFKLFLSEKNIHVSFLLPLGISFYTFQAIGYVVDVFYGKAKAEKNYFKLLLFISFFPQIVQGPISKFGQLMPQLTQGNKLKFDNIKFGSQLILWGLLKKLIIADIIVSFVNPILSSPENYTGIQVFIGSLASYIQVYGDFSGGIDITRGTAQLFGIDMIQNFKNPFFATSLTDYWRRWHISLGNFMKDYVMMPMNISKTFVKIGKWSRNKFGVNIGKLVPVFVSSFIVFFLVGIWHGPNFKYIVFGVVNGLVVSLETVYNTVKVKKEHGRLYSGFKYALSLVYTEFIVFIINTISMSPSLKQSFTIFKNILTDFNITQAKTEFLNLFSALNFPLENFLIVMCIFALVIFVEIFRELGFEIRKTIDKQNILVIYAVYLFIIFVILIYSSNGNAPSGFAYAAF